MAEGMAFDQMKPPLHITDPIGFKEGLTEWPKHMHKAGTTDDGGPVYLEVHSEADVAAAIADGWYVARADALAAGAEAPRPGPPPARKR